MALHISDSDNARYFEEPRIPLRFMGFYVATSFLTDAPAAFESHPEYHSSKRNQYLKKIIGDWNINIAALVEFSPAQAQFISENFPGHNFVGYFSETEDSYEDTMKKIAADPEHIKCVGECVGFLISKNITIISKVCERMAPGPRHKRIAVVVDIACGSGKVVRLVSTHLDHISRESRQKSLDKLAAIVSVSSFPIIMYGDFNLFPDDGGEEDYTKFMEYTELVDAMLVNHTGPHGTVCGFAGQLEKFMPKIETHPKNGKKYIPNSNRLDLILVSNSVKIRGSRSVVSVVESDTNKIYYGNWYEKYSELFERRQFPSDHLPQIIEF